MLTYGPNISGRFRSFCRKRYIQTYRTRALNPLEYLEAPMDDQSWKAEYFKLLNKPRWSEVRREEAFVLREQHIPPTLFKYRDFDKDGYNIANLENGVIRFSSPNCFNDP